MTKNNKFEYEVVKGEKVTINISFTPASQSGSFFVLTLDGKTLKPSGPSSQFVFPVTKSPDQEHTVIMDFTFMPDAPDTARYNVKLSGSKGGAFSFAVKATDAIPDPAVVFMVVAG